MQAKLTITTEDGITYQGEVRLTPANVDSGVSKSAGPIAAFRRDFDFTMPLRAFVTAHGARKMAGPQKFTLLLAGITKGDTTAMVDASEIQKHWEKMTEPMGGKFNAAYPTRAKDKGWVESPKQGIYKLRTSWADAVSS